MLLCCIFEIAGRSSNFRREGAVQRCLWTRLQGNSFLMWCYVFMPTNSCIDLCSSAENIRERCWWHIHLREIRVCQKKMRVNSMPTCTCCQLVSSASRVSFQFNEFIFLLDPEKGKYVNSSIPKDIPFSPINFDHVSDLPASMDILYLVLVIE